MNKAVQESALALLTSPKYVIKTNFKDFNKIIF